MKIHHINCGALKAFPNDLNPRSIVHCLVLEEGNRLVLVDSGFGLEEMRRPEQLLSKEAVEFWGIEGDERLTATRELERLELDPASVTDIVLTHGDMDHVGGLVDFPAANLHVSKEELAAIQGTSGRYVSRQFAHQPRFKAYENSSRNWFDLKARPVRLGLASEVLLVPLFGHTLGHCGVAIEHGGGWLLHAGDSYYRRVEVDFPEHPVASVVRNFAVDNEARLRSLELLRRLVTSQAGTVQILCAHDMNEYSDTANPLNLNLFPRQAVT